MKPFSKLFIGGFALALMISCSPTSKENYMERFVEFLDEVYREYKEYTPGDWAKMDDKFEKLTGEWYQEYEDEMSFKEEMKVQGYKLKYAYYRTLSDGKSTFNGIMESIDVEGMKKDINQAAKGFKEAAGEIVNSVDMEQVKKEMEKVGEEIVKAAGEVGKTIDSLAGKR